MQYKNPYYKTKKCLWSGVLDMMYMSFKIVAFVRYNKKTVQIIIIKSEYFVCEKKEKSRAYVYFVCTVQCKQNIVAYVCMVRWASNSVSNNLLGTYIFFLTGDAVSYRDSKSEFMNIKLTKRASFSIVYNMKLLLKYILTTHMYLSLVGKVATF